MGLGFTRPRRRSVCGRLTTPVSHRRLSPLPVTTTALPTAVLCRPSSLLTLLILLLTLLPTHLPTLLLTIVLTLRLTLRLTHLLPSPTSSLLPTRSTRRGYITVRTAS